MQLRKATKKKSKLKIGLSGTSGSGKTYSALLMASGMTEWEKICIIDTENCSADLYSNLGPYNVITLEPPFSPERYIEAIKTAEIAGMEVIIIDSITHEWDGQGGCLEIIEQGTKASVSKNSYTAWAKVTPRHNAFVQAILQSPCHVITTVRRKQDYDMSKDQQGKTVIAKVGMKEITREGFEYELTLSFALSQNHLAETSKDRTGLYMDKPEFVISDQTGKELLDWAEEGEEEPRATASQLKKIRDLVKVTNANQENLKKYFGVSAMTALSEVDADKAVKILEAKVKQNKTEKTDIKPKKEVKETKKKSIVVKAEKQSDSTCLCEECGNEISEKVANFSEEKYARWLCYECQKKQK